MCSMREIVWDFRRSRAECKGRIMDAAIKNQDGFLSAKNIWLGI